MRVASASVAQRVKSLTYTVSQTDPARTISPQAPPVKVELDRFTCRLEGARLTVIPSDDYDDEASAIAVLAPLLRGWEAKTDLVDGYPLRFDFLTAQLEEVDPPPDEQIGHASTAVVAIQVMEVTVCRERLEYPLPDPAIRFEGHLTELLRPRWRQVLRGKDSLTTVAYVIVTTLEEHCGGSAKAAKTLNISSKVLTELRRLASVPDPQHGRKASKQTGTLTIEHIRWIREACAVILRRLLEYEAGADLSHKITKADFLQSLPKK